LAAIIYPT